MQIDAYKNLEEQLNNHQQTIKQQDDEINETHQTTRRMTTWGALKQDDGETQEDKMQSTNTENEEQQGSPEHMEHQWHMENDSNNVFRNDLITFKGINKHYLTLPREYFSKTH